MAQQPYKREGIALEDVLDATAKKTALDQQLILCRSKRTAHADARMIFCYFAGEPGFPTRDAGLLLGIQQAAVSNAARRGAVLAQKRNIVWE